MPDYRLSDSLEELIGWAVIDSQFADRLLQDPVSAAAARGIPLSTFEVAVMGTDGADDVADLASRWRRAWGNATRRPSFQDIQPAAHSRVAGLRRSAELVGA